MGVDRQEIAHVDTQNLLVPYIRCLKMCSPSIQSRPQGATSEKSNQIFGESFKDESYELHLNTLKKNPVQKPSNCQRTLCLSKKNLIRNKYSKDIWKKIPPTTYENKVSHFHPEVAIFQFLLFVIFGWFLDGFFLHLRSPTTTKLEGTISAWRSKKSNMVDGSEIRRSQRGMYKTL